MSLVSYSYSTDSEDDFNDNNNEPQYLECNNQISETNRRENIETKRKIISAFNVNSNKNETNYQKNIKLRSNDKHSTLLDILPIPKCSQSKKFGDSAKKQAKLIPINVLKNLQNTSKNIKKEHVIKKDNFLFSTEIYALKKNVNNVKSAKNEFNLSASTFYYNDVAKNITSINLSENQYKRLKKDDPNIRNINVTDMLEDQKLRICKNFTKDICKVSQENVKEPSIPSRKKNHITYLAYRAKINEQELKNQWSLNKMTRQQTRLKYGF